MVESREELTTARAIRRQVFIEEQAVPPEIELDEHDEIATHVLAYLGDEPAGTARWRETAYGIKLERFAVPEPFRGLGVGRNLVLFVLDLVEGTKQIYLHAQSDVIGFYEKYGFECSGDVFYEAGMPHRRMMYTAGHLKRENLNSANV